MSTGGNWGVNPISRTAGNVDEPAGSPTDRDEPLGWVVVAHPVGTGNKIVVSDIIGLDDARERLPNLTEPSAFTYTVEPIGHQTGDREESTDTQARGAAPVGELVAEEVEIAMRGLQWGEREYVGKTHGEVGRMVAAMVTDRLRAHPGGTPDVDDCLDCGVCPSCVERSMAYAEERGTPETEERERPARNMLASLELVFEKLNDYATKKNMDDWPPNYPQALLGIIYADLAAHFTPFRDSLRAAEVETEEREEVVGAHEEGCQVARCVNCTEAVGESCQCRCTCWWKDYAAVSIGTRIMANRAKAGLTQTVLAERVGITQGHLSMIENGQRQPSFDVADRLLHACGASLTVRRGGAASPEVETEEREERRGLGPKMRQGDCGCGAFAQDGRRCQFHTNQRTYSGDLNRRAASPEVETCGSTSPGGLWTCQLPKGHAGDHGPRMPETEPTYAPPTPESLRAMAEWYDENEPEVTYEGVSAGMVLRSIAYRLEHRRPARGDGGEADG